MPDSIDHTTTALSDIPISDLPVASSAIDGDYFIINKQNKETRRINFENLSKYTGFSPIYVQMDIISRTNLMEPPGALYVVPGQCAYTNCDSVNGTDNRDVVDELDLISKTLTPKDNGGVGPNAGEMDLGFTTRATFTLPDGADSCIILYNATVTAACGTQPVANSTAFHTGRGMVKNRFTVTGGDFSPSNVNGKINSSTAFIGSWSRATQIGRRYDRKQNTKILNVDNISGPVTLTNEGFFQDTLKYYFLCGPGTLQILPFASTNATALGYRDGLTSITKLETSGIGAIEPALYAEAMQESSKNILIQTIRAIETTKNVGTREDGTDWTSSQAQNMDDAMKELYRLRYTYSGNTNGLETEIDRIIEELGQTVPEVTFTFDLTDAPSTFKSIF